MKDLTSIFILFSILFFFLSCEKDSEQVNINTGEENIKIYYTYKDSNKQLASDDDTLTISLGDTLSLSIEIIEITDIENAELDSVRIFITDNFETEETGSYEYLCVAKETGLGAIITLVSGSELPSDLIDYLYVNISYCSYSFLVVEEPSFIIDVGNESLATKIKAELKDNYAPGFIDNYRLTCSTFYGGDLQLITARNDTITGTFTSSDVFEMEDITMNYNNSCYNFTLEQKEEDSDFFYLKQDLTEAFRTKYPTETINKVTINTLSVMNKIK